MKNFDIFGVHWKITVLVRVHEKLVGDCLKRRAWQERGGGVFDEGGVIPQHILWQSGKCFLI